MRLVNLTAHTVVLMPDGREQQRIQPIGTLARIREVVTIARPLATDQGPVPTVHLAYAPQIEGLPGPEPGVAYIVSRVTAAAVSRPDVYFPHEEVRDHNGSIIGCRALGTFALQIPQEAAGA